MNHLEFPFRCYVRSSTLPKTQAGCRMPGGLSSSHAKTSPELSWCWKTHFILLECNIKRGTEQPANPTSLLPGHAVTAPPPGLASPASWPLRAAGWPGRGPAGAGVGCDRPWGRSPVPVRRVGAGVCRTCWGAASWRASEVVHRAAPGVC